jgi:hypothetical protein
MTPRKSHRVRKARTIWEQKGAPPVAKDPKITRKTARTVEKTALKPIATDPLSIAVGFNADHLPKLPTYKPLLNLEFQLSQSLNIGLSQLEVFRQLFTPFIIDIIVATTNNYTVNARTNHSDLLKPNSHARS